MTLDKTKADWRLTYPGIKELHKRFWANFNTLRNEADHSLIVNRQRDLVLEDCLQAAVLEPGLF